MWYADDGIVGSQGPKQLQDANQNLCDLFCNCISLKPTTKKKTEVMECHPSAIQTGAFIKCRL